MEPPKRMSTVTPHLTFVKEQQAYHDKLSRKFASEPWRHELHKKSVEKFSALAEFLVQSEAGASSRRNQDLQNLTLTPEEVEGLPPELVAELSISEADKLEFLIIGAIKEAGGMLNLDRILISLFRKTGEVYKRNTTTSKLYRMIQKGLLFPVGARKGVYSIDPVDDTEAGSIDGERQLSLTA